MCEELRVRKVEPWRYNVLRSFVESSTSPSYTHNIPFKEEGKVLFFKPGKWILTVYPEQGKAVLTTDEGLHVITYDYLNHKLCYAENECIEAGKIEAIEPDAKVSFSKRIYTFLVVEKMNHYLDLAGRCAGEKGV